MDDSYYNEAWLCVNSELTKHLLESSGEIITGDIIPFEAELPA
jgi:hypothetical protein